MVLALGLWMGIFMISAVVVVTSLIHLEKPWAVAILLFVAFMTVVPVDENSFRGRGLARWIAKTVPRHFPLKVIVTRTLLFLIHFQ